MLPLEAKSGLNIPEKGLESFGNKLWRGSVLRVIQPTELKPRSTTEVSFVVQFDGLPFDGRISREVVELLDFHGRTRYAHCGFHIEKEIFRKRLKSMEIPGEGKESTSQIPVTNYGSRSIVLDEKSRPGHPFLVPEAAIIRGQELEQVVGSEEGKPVCIQGKEGDEWKFIRNGQATAVLLRISSHNRFTIPPANSPIHVTENGTFLDFREWFKSVAQRIDYNSPISSDMFWIGQGPHITLSRDVYLRLSRDVYREVDGELVISGMQTSSPLLEALRTNHAAHFEIVGQGDWVKADAVRNGSIVTAG